MQVDLTHNTFFLLYKWLSFSQVAHLLPLIFTTHFFKSFSTFVLLSFNTSMETYANDYSLKASLTLQTSNSFRDVSFSSYLNQAEEHMIRNLTDQVSHVKNKQEKDKDDEELGVFGAEKYFKGEIEDVESKNDQQFVDKYDTRTKIHQQKVTVEQFDPNFAVKLKTDLTKLTSTHTPSVQSNVSYNSNTGLLPRAKSSKGRIERGSKTKTFLATFGCNCIDKKSTQISEKRISKPHTRMCDFDPKASPLSSKSKLTERTVRNDYFTFPVLNSTDPNSNNSDLTNLKYGNLAGKVEDGNNGGRLSLGRKLSLLNNWEVDISTEDEMYVPASGMYNHHDVDSDSSSDLFEIESFSTTCDNSFVAPRTSNGYAPSEVSVDWSVVTASAADFSVVSDYEEMRTGGGWRVSGGNGRGMVNRDEQKKRPGILSGCTNYKAVRVAGDGYKVGGGGVGGGGGAGGRRRLSDSIAVGSMFRGGII
ncbi:putative protein PHYTOCHROME KINASE SUBSTRATE [Helianthus annuus]|nr:putative protein PHYTOCHROME KINASE SUBSTRATE [Helianthus annuus]